MSDPRKYDHVLVHEPGPLANWYPARYMGTKYYPGVGTRHRVARRWHGRLFFLNYERRDIRPAR